MATAIVSRSRPKPNETSCFSARGDHPSLAVLWVALSNPDYLRFAGAGKPKLVKIVPGRLVNIVV